MRAVSWLAVTPDRQAEVRAPRNAFAVSHQTDGVVVRIDPVDPPAAVPTGLQVDGNAYRVTAAQDPGNRPARLVRVLTVTLAWPHRPLALYRYGRGRWNRLCSIGQSHAGEGHIACGTAALGVFAAVRSASAASPVSSGTSLWPYAIALSAICAVLILAIALLRRSSHVARG